MKKLLATGALLALLTVSLLAQTSREPVKNLGDGFQSKQRSGVTLVHFPESCMTAFPAFKACIDKALVKVYGCKEFPLCEPKQQKGPDGVFVKTRTQGFVPIDLMYEDGSHERLVGVSFNNKKEKKGVQTDE